MRGGTHWSRWGPAPELGASAFVVPTSSYCSGWYLPAFCLSSDLLSSGFGADGLFQFSPKLL